MPAVCWRMTQGSRADGMLGADRLRVDDRALAGDRDGLLHGRDAELRVDRGSEADRDDDALVDDRLEAGQLELHRVGADFNPREIERARLARDRRQRLEQHRTRDRHRDARQDRARTVGDFAEDLARLTLRARDRARGEKRHQCQHDYLESHPPS